MSAIEHPGLVAKALAMAIRPLLGEKKGEWWHFSLLAKVGDDGSIELENLSYNGPTGCEGSLRGAFYPPSQSDRGADGG